MSCETAVKRPTYALTCGYAAAPCCPPRASDAGCMTTNSCPICSEPITSPTAETCGRSCGQRLRNLRRGPMSCAVEGCERDRNCRGWCTMHYGRWLRHGDPEYVATRQKRGRKPRPPKPRPTTADRFWTKVDPVDGCWEWQGRAASHGYGTISINGRRVYAHRLSYELNVGPIPEGMEIDHLCRNRICVNPEHLEPVTHRENGLRGTSPCAVNAAKTHCIHGHEFTPENTYHRPDRTGRQCVTCNAERRR